MFRLDLGNMASKSKRGIFGFIIGFLLIAYGFGMGWIYAKVQGSQATLTYGALADLETKLKNQFDGQIDESKLVDGAKAGLVSAAGDPYTVYLTANEAKQLNDDLSGTLSGIGAEIGQKDGNIVIVAPLDGSPAAAAGLRAGDIIVKIGKIDTQGMSVASAVDKIRGPAGTEIALELARGSKIIDVTIKRAVITEPSVKWSMKDGGVGYIKVTRFATDTGSKLQDAAKDLKSQGATKVLLDLRNDPGGYLDSAVQVASQFLPAGKVVVEERHGGKTQQKLQSMAGGQLIGLPLVVLINGGSASASEIVTGALSDQGVAKVAGEQSFGKGSVQTIEKLDNGTELKVTVAHWFTPKGHGIDHQGIKPDVEIKQPDNNDSLSDPQLDQALALLK